MRDCLRRMDEALAAETDGSEIDDDFLPGDRRGDHNQYVLHCPSSSAASSPESRRMAWVDSPARHGIAAWAQRNIFACSMRLPPGAASGVSPCSSAWRGRARSVSRCLADLGGNKPAFYRRRRVSLH